MKSILFSIILLPIVALALGRRPAQAQHAAENQADTTAAMRPIHVLDDDIRWNKASTDLFTYWIDNGLYGFYGPQPDIFVDGLPVDANFFGWQNLNMLPIGPTEKTEQLITPGTHYGFYTPAGALNFNHAPTDTGFSANGTFYAGNESGDPGPYVYDSLKTTPNVDRWGPDAEIALAYGSENWYGRGLWLMRNHFPTDLASNGRLHFTASLLGTNVGYENHRIYTSTQSGLLETGYRSDRWHIRARTAYGHSNDYIFLQPYGREIPAESRYRQIAVEASYQEGPWTLNSRYVGDRKQVDKRIGLHTYIFDWDQRSHTMSVTAAYKTDDINVQPGLSYERLQTNAPGLNTTYNDLITLFLNSTVPINSNSDLQSHINIDYDELNFAKTLDFKTPTRLSGYWLMTPRLLHAEVAPIRQHAFTYWVNRGYTFAEELGIPFFTSAVLKESSLTQYSLRNRISFTPDIYLVLEPQLIDHQRLNVPYQKVESYEFVTDTRPGPFNVTQEKGNRFQFFAELGHTFSGRFHHSLGINLQHTLSGSDRYRAYFDQIPETKVLYRFTATPVPSLTLSMNALYRSATTWHEFERIEGNEYRLPSGIPIRVVTGTFHTKTPAYTDITLSLKKWFWDRRLSTRFTLRNLLNEEVRMHTLGAQLYTKFDFKIQLHL